MRAHLFIALLFVLLVAGCQSNQDGGIGDTSGSFSPFKGPFISGTADLQPVDCVSLDSIGSVRQLQINSIGKFDIPSDLESWCVQVTASGSYFNEVTALNSDSDITLTGLADLRVSTNFTVTVLTTITQGRETALVGQGMTLSDAQYQAFTELTESLGLGAMTARAADLNFSETPAENSVLLWMSAALLAHGGSSADISVALMRLQSDLSDGAIDEYFDFQQTQTNLNYLLAGSNLLDPAQVRQNIIEFYWNRGEDVTPPDFSATQQIMCDTDFDGIRCAQDDDMPDPVSLNSFTNVHFGQVVTTNTVTLSGVNTLGHTLVTTSHGTLIVNGVDTGLAEANLQPGDTVAVSTPALFATVSNGVEYFYSGVTQTVTLSLGDLDVPFTVGMWSPISTQISPLGVGATADSNYYPYVAVPASTAVDTPITVVNLPFYAPMADVTWNTLPNDNSTITIHADNGGQPGAVLATADYVLRTMIPGTDFETSGVFWNGFTLLAGVNYWFVGQSANGVMAGIFQGTGQNMTSVDGVTWTLQSPTSSSLYFLAN